MYEQRVLDALAPAVADRAARDELTVLRTHRRYRSSLYFVGVRDGLEPRWVVKRPDPDRRQQDLRPPPDAEAQFDALCRLHEHLGASGDDIMAPRPVALLQQIEALAMEYVAGQTLTDLMKVGRVVRPEPLLDGVARAAAALRLIHRLAPSVSSTVDENEWMRHAAREARRHLLVARLPFRHSWLTVDSREWLTVDSREPRYVEPAEVLLHGDWAPENVVLGDHGLTCLDPELSHRGWPERDVSRFLVMLCDAPVFVTTTGLPAWALLRRRAAVTFLAAFYGDRGVSPLLRPLFLADLAARWAMRDVDVVRRNPAGTRSRRLLLRHHFTALLDEASDPGWPGNLLPHAVAAAAR